jgi:hypothetical protein
VRNVWFVVRYFLASLILLLLFDKRPYDNDVVTATVVAMTMITDNMMATMCMIDDSGQEEN